MIAPPLRTGVVVLVVDDDPAMASMLADGLDASRAAVAAASARMAASVASPNVLDNRLGKPEPLARTDQGWQGPEKVQIVLDHRVLAEVLLRDIATRKAFP